MCLQIGRAYVFEDDEKEGYRWIETKQNEMSGYSRRPNIKIGFMNLYGNLTAKRLWEESHGKNDGTRIKNLS